MNLKDIKADELRTYINTALHAGEVVVEFTKVNGELRRMPCTLMESKLPAVVAKPTKSGAPRAVSTETARVFCTDKQEWRSFRYDSVISITESN